MDHSILHLKNVVWIGVQAGAPQELIEVVQVRAVKENDSRTVRRNALRGPKFAAGTDNPGEHQR